MFNFLNYSFNYANNKNKGANNKNNFKGFLINRNISVPENSNYTNISNNNLKSKISGKLNK